MNFFFTFLSYLKGNIFIRNTSFSYIFSLYFFLLTFFKPNSEKKLFFKKISFFNFLISKHALVFLLVKILPFLIYVFSEIVYAIKH